MKYVYKVANIHDFQSAVTTEDYLNTMGLQGWLFLTAYRWSDRDMMRYVFVKEIEEDEDFRPDIPKSNT